MLCLGLAISLSKNCFPFNAASNHWFLVATTITCFICGLLFFQANLLVIEIVPVEYISFTQLDLFDSQSTINFFIFVVSIYLLVCISLFIDRFVSFVGLNGLSKKLTPIQRYKEKVDPLKKEWKVGRRVRVLKGEEVVGPMTWGVFRPVIALPENYNSWSENRFERVLSHELVHIHRKDWLIKIFCQFISSFFWFLPFVWGLCKKIEWYSELSCDDRVIKKFDCRDEYAQDLLDLSDKGKSNSLVLSFRRESDLFERIKYTLDGRVHRERPKAWLRIITIGAGSLLMSSVFAMHLGVKPIEMSNFDSFRVSFSDLSGKEEINASEVLGVPSVELPVYIAHTQTLARKEIEEVNVWAERMERTEFSKEKNINFGDPQESLRSDVVEISRPSVDVKGHLPKVLSLPVYPTRALRREIEGLVIVQFDIVEEGLVQNPVFRVTEPKGVFEKSVLKALEESQYTPMLLDGKPIKIKNVSKTFKFKIHESKTNSPAKAVRPEYTRITRVN